MALPACSRPCHFSQGTRKYPTLSLPMNTLHLLRRKPEVILRLLHGGAKSKSVPHLRNEPTSHMHRNTGHRWGGRKRRWVRREVLSPMCPPVLSCRQRSKGSQAENTTVNTSLGSTRLTCRAHVLCLFPVLGMKPRAPLRSSTLAHTQLNSEITKAFAPGLQRCTRATQEATSHQQRIFPAGKLCAVLDWAVLNEREGPSSNGQEGRKGNLKSF